METSQDIPGNCSKYCLLLPNESYVAGEGIHVWWDEGQIMEVINLKKQAKNSRFYSLVLFTRPVATLNLMKVMKKKAFILLLCLRTFLHWSTHATELVLHRQGFFWPSYHLLTQL